MATGGATTAQALMVEFSCEVWLEHEPLDVDGMFKVTASLDFHEVLGQGEHRPLNVDVLEVTPTQTRLRCTPVRAMTYEQIGTEVKQLVNGPAAGLFGSPPRVIRVTWDVTVPGVASDQRQHRRRIA